MPLEFDWDDAKNFSNQRKHGISFEEAATVFLDPHYLSVLDRVVDDEQRWQTFGLVRGVVLTMVAHTIEDEDSPTLMIRIISARSATPRERYLYENQHG